MIVEYVRYTIDAARQAQFIADYKRASVPLQKSPFCLGYEFSQCDEDKSEFIVRIQWTSANDHLQGFRKSAEFRDFLPHIKDYIDDLNEMRHYTVAV